VISPADPHAVDWSAVCDSNALDDENRAAKDRFAVSTDPAVVTYTLMFVTVTEFGSFNRATYINPFVISNAGMLHVSGSAVHAR
jgi:hypothetical protein